MFDVYRDNSIKTTEREDRGVASGLAHGSIVVGHKIQWWRRLPRSSASKTALIKFLCQAWRNDPYAEKLGSKLLLIKCGKQCFKVTKYGSEVVDELTTSKEEADTRTLLHTKHASSNYIHMVIVTEDTDVFIICLSVFHLYIRCGTKTDYNTLTLAKLSSLLVKRLVKLYMDFMHSPAATPSAPIVVGENQCSEAGFEGSRLKKAMVGVCKAWIKGEVGTVKVV